MKQVRAGSAPSPAARERVRVREPGNRHDNITDWGPKQFKAHYDAISVHPEPAGEGFDAQSNPSLRSGRTGKKFGNAGAVVGTVCVPLRRYEDGERVHIRTGWGLK